jgi:hypothetical protein
MSLHILEFFLFRVQTPLLPNDDALPTASVFTESFEENFLSNGASLPNSAHKSVPFLYQFLCVDICPFNYGIKSDFIPELTINAQRL